jgi:branched-chain amino acid transport system permease protein
MGDHRKTIFIGGILVAILVLAPVFIKLGTHILDLFVLLFIYIILAESWNLIGGYTGQINLGLASFFGCGVLVTHLLWAAGVNFYLAFLIGGIAATVLSVVIGVPTLRLRGIYFAIGTLALAEALRITAGNTFSKTIYMPINFATYTLLPRYYLGLSVMVITLVTLYLLTNTPAGLAMVAIREDEIAASVNGVDILKFKVLALTISSFLAGLAGGIFAFYQMAIVPSSCFTPIWTFEPLMAVCIGGPGTLLGPIIGSIFLVVLRELFVHSLGKAHLIIFGVLFILVVLFLPRGLIEIEQKVRKVFLRIAI